MLEEICCMLPKTFIKNFFLKQKTIGMINIKITCTEQNVL